MNPRLTFLPLLVLSGLLTTICAAQTTNEPVTIVSHVDIIPDAYKPLSIENAAKLFRTQAAATKHDAGLISFVFLQQDGLSNHFTLVETWRDTHSYEMHQGADHTVEFRKDILPYLGSPFDSREYHPFR